MTEQRLHLRMNGHRASAKAGKNLYLYQHFQQNGHNFENATVQIIDYIDSNTVPDITKALGDLEQFWINTLSTAYPLGLNDNIKGSGNISQSSIIDVYFTARITRYNRGHGRKSHLRTEKRKKKIYKDNEEIEQVKRNIKNDFMLNKNIFYKKITSLQNRQLKQVYKSCGDEIGFFYNVFRSWVHTFSPPKTRTPKKDTDCIIFNFSSKALDHINLNSIVRDTRVQSFLPNNIIPFCPLKVYYKYDLPLGRRICNYSNFLKNLDSSQIRSILDGSCSCTNSPFLYPPRGHVLTGNLGIVADDDLRLLMSYGTKYREPVYLSASDLSNSLLRDVDNFIKNKSRKYKLQNNSFEDWKNNVNRIINNKIKFFAEHKPHLFSSKTSALKEHNVKSCLDALKDKYIICSVDKASSNYVFICKKLYVIILMTELGVDLETLDCIGNTTYQPVVRTEDDIIISHCDILSGEFGIDVTDENKCIPKIFWNPKLHKTPYKARFIAGASNCTTKQLSVYVNKALKVVREYFSRYCSTVYKNSGVNCNWSINSSTQFIEKLQNIDVFNIQVYDFTTLYTNLDLGVVEKLLSEMIDLLFSNINKYICISKFEDKSFFSKKVYNNYYCFDSELLKKAIKFLLQNTFVSFGNIILRQTKGIPMGGNSSSQFADLSLAKSEFDYQKSLLASKKMNLAKLLSNNGRYVDDLCVFNYLNFANLISDIYPEDLVMERSGDNNKDINYLDIRIKICNGNISTEVYNKVEDFNFPVVMYTFPNGNMPVNIGYNVFYGQLLRYSNICSHVSSFVFSSNKLYCTLVSRSYNHWQLVLKFRTLLRNHPHILLKYQICDAKSIEKDIFKIDLTV